MTPESAFGFERRGTPETVAELGRALGYEVVVVPQFTLEGEPIKSSAIRAAIAAGDLARAARFLGHGSPWLGRQPGRFGTGLSSPSTCRLRCRRRAATRRPSERPVAASARVPWSSGTAGRRSCRRCRCEPASA